jgi:hypothetical protein
MKLEIVHQESYSRGALLLRTFFGGLYIALPHMFVRFFVGIWYGIQTALLPWVILFTGNMPKSWYDFRVGYIRWGLRLTASLQNLTDEYPSFGVKGESETVILEMDQPEKLSRLLNFLMFIKGIAVIPHMIVLGLRLFVSAILMGLGWWVVLFTGRWPEGMFKFQVGTIRWNIRVSNYLAFMTDQYPPFNGKPDEA